MNKIKIKKKKEALQVEAGFKSHLLSRDDSKEA
jgi:hypothetical protein